MTEIASEIAATIETPAVETPAVEETAKVARDGARFAELAKRQRELTQKQLEIKAKEERYTPVEQALANAKSNPLAALEALGMTYEDLTHFILNEGREPAPEDKLSAIEKRLDEKEKQERDAREAAENAKVEATITAFQESITQAVTAAPEQYEMILSAGDFGTSLVFDTISEYFDSNKQLLPLETALQAVETYLEGEALKVAKANKIQAKLAPVVQAQETVKPPEKNGTVTLTNKLVSSAAEPTKRLTDDESKRLAAQLLKWNN